jgi:hypothetical protein
MTKLYRFHAVNPSQSPKPYLLTVLQIQRLVTSKGRETSPPEAQKTLYTRGLGQN